MFQWFHLQKSRCPACAFPVARKRTYHWSVKAIRRKTTRTGRMRYLLNVPRRFKSSFRKDYGVDKYDLGTGFGHFAIATPDVSNHNTVKYFGTLFECGDMVSSSHVQVYKLVEDIKAKGGIITREPGPVKGGKTVIAFAKDPDGYLFELIQRGPTPEPLCQVMLRVGDLDRSIKFYEKVLFYWLIFCVNFTCLVNLLFKLTFQLKM
ncbi:hypothetical protein ACSBR1_025870 [Camellia fascicularis]